jgi:hypothetical protein
MPASAKHPHVVWVKPQSGLLGRIEVLAARDGHRLGIQFLPHVCEASAATDDRGHSFFKALSCDAPDRTCGLSAS